MPLRLNIGCGQSPTPGWTNYDNSPALWMARSRLLTLLLRTVGLVDAASLAFVEFCRTHDIAYANASSRVPEASATVDVVYSSHMIEHLDRIEARGFLQECHRILKPGGVMRLAVPDLKLEIEGYLAHGDADRFLSELQFDLEKPRSLPERARRALTGGRGHHWMYDRRSLTKLAADVGFTAIRILEPGETRIPEPGDLNLREREAESLYLEALRP